MMLMMMMLLLSLLLLWSIPSSSFQNVLLPFHQEVNEGCVDEWAEQLGETLDLLRSLRDAGARVNVSCQMGHLANGRVSESAAADGEYFTFGMLPPSR